MAQRRGDLRLTPEPLDRRGPTAQQLGRQHLDGDLAVEPDVVRQVHETHASATQDAEDVVLAEGGFLEVAEELGIHRFGDGHAAGPAETVANHEVGPALRARTHGGAGRGRTPGSRAHARRYVGRNSWWLEDRGRA